MFQIATMVPWRLVCLDIVLLNRVQPHVIVGSHDLVSYVSVIYGRSSCDAYW